MTTPAVIEPRYRVLQDALDGMAAFSLALETAIYGFGPECAPPVEVTHSGAVPDVVSETIDLRQGRRRLVPLRAVRHVHDYGGPLPGG